MSTDLYLKIMETISIEPNNISNENLLTCAQIKHYASIGRTLWENLQLISKK